MISDINWIKRMLSHNVRMPMSVITGYGELLRQGLLSPEEQKTVIDSICDNISYMNDVLKVVLEEDMMTEGKIEAVNISAIVWKTASYVQEIANKIGVKIYVKTEKPDIPVKAEAIPVMKVFYQLFENSMKYIGGGDSINITVYYAGKDKVLVVFKDNGKGVSEEDIEKIFEKGYRGSNSEGKSGSGYGLYDVKETVERYGGTVKVSSKEESGFSVYIMFPVYKE